MERLTKKEQLAGHEVKYVSDDDCFDVWSTPRKFMGTAIDRLAAYEDTGLEPERVAELAQAEKDGRLVVLPKEKEVTDEEIAELTGYKCPICKHHHLCTMPGMRAMCGESYTHFEPRKPQEAEEAMRKEDRSCTLPC